ncbi:sugar phosphate isomerase/epimerase [Robertkochia marina]|uniref:Sugar phosphate isomerase/epimerase n=1 Tax=Robertkochia marina TaxID=1227945 RepID=A0A4S3M399_9FLAO|nr:sugar phosphate isomerase/epimerase [Robertkochia marina]THD69370.1 sugar phosphate isomerase/epimerase [Robertkochia marina]TRZ47370.1 sugar phosphate isomerase/epimerase [Robertkochia marina]
MTFKNSFIYFMAFTLVVGSFYSCETIGSKGTGGLALYTVRAEMKQSADSTLQQVANAGYAYIEAAGYEDGKYYGYSPEGFKNLLEEKGLTPISTHQSSVTLENADKLIADAKAAGFTYFVVPIPPMGMFVYDREAMSMGMNGRVERLAEILTELGQKCNAAGLQLLYHNHDFEFKPNKEGVVPIDYLLENTDPELVNFQMDLFWVTSAGADPLAYFEEYPGRFKLWHVKDMDDKGRFAPVGQGNIDFKKILEQKEKSGMKYYFVEQDMTFDQSPLEAIKISHEGIEAIGFE